MIPLLLEMVDLQQKVIYDFIQLLRVRSEVFVWRSDAMCQSGSSTNTPSLTIFYAELSDAGIYTCFASNSDATGESDMTTLMVSGTLFLVY
jgi:hypothetical protein